MKTKILLVEDDINLGDVLCDYLELQDHEVVRAMDVIMSPEIPSIMSSEFFWFFTKLASEF